MLQSSNPFAQERNNFEPLITSERILLGALGIAASIGTILPILWPNQIKEVKLIENIAGLSFATCFTTECFRRQRKEKTYQSIDEANYQIVKEGLRNTFVYEKAAQEINSKRELAAYINRLPMEERGRWMQQYGLQGLVELPQIQQAVIEPTRQLSGSRGIPSPEVAAFNEDAVQAIINPGAMAVLEELAAQYPDYIRIDSEWLDELCDSASLHNMSNRSNHHFMLVGGTQSGKSTLAGVIINKIAANSQNSSIVIGSDPKDQVTRWLCQFSRKFDGMKQLSNWIKFATEVIDIRQKEIGKNGGCNGISELFLIQDEVDTCYGGGKGFPGLVTKETALELQALWNYIIKFTAGLKCHGVFMGQSPLSEATGFSRPNLKNICFMALGQMSSYILGKPTDFLNAKPELIELMKQVCELLDKQGARYALVVPTRGNPYVALIPQFDIEGMEVKNFDADNLHQDVTQDINPYQIIKDWIKQLGKNPTDSQLVEAWKKVTGIELTSDALQLLKNNLELTDKVVTWATITSDLQLPEKWKEEDLQKAIASRLIEYGYNVQTEVKCNGGFIDIATDFDGGTIVEVKKYLTRDTIYQAAGQLHLYGIGNEYKLLAMGFLPFNESDQQQAKTTASMVSQDERISCLFIE